ncbi:hypothetical protein AB3X52_09595 [Nocardioides sp. DS6]|uniref:Sulfotransferase family protein n=1 Tax=Nocardioides eburneus TaxID=3231482 RepID=A0ABV3SYD3_9ACTN
MTKRVLLHVGTPKTGTTYLQDVLFRNRERLVGHGICYPADRFDAHFLAALDLMKLPWGGLEAESLGAWERLAAAVRDAPDGSTVIVSHEILAHASRQQADAALASFGEGCEVHLLLSVRDLARQIPAEWQENVKHRSTLTYARFLARIQDPARDSQVGSWFWAVQELPDILDRWGHRLPPEQIHLITVPPAGSDRTLLWKRFSNAFGLDGLELDLRGERANPSLGVPETALLRRINLKANGVVAPADYRPLVRELLAHRVLSQRRGSPRLALPPDVAPWVEQLSRRWVEELRSRRYDVVGSLDELVGVTGDPTAYADPDRPRPRQVAAASVDVIEALLVENARARHEERRLHGELAELRDAYHRLEESRLQRRIYLRLERSLAGRVLLRVYRVVRGRSSRAA